MWVELLRHGRFRCVTQPSTVAPTSRFDADHPHYRWVALSNTTLGMLMATINSSIVIISLPAIFRGIKLNPLEPGTVSYLLWIIMGYLVVSAVLVVTLGRLGDIYGRVRMYNLGFAVFALGALFLPFDPLTGPGDPDRRVPRRRARHGHGHQPGGRHLRPVHRPDPGRRAGRRRLAPGVHR